MEKASQNGFKPLGDDILYVSRPMYVESGNDSVATDSRNKYGMR